MMSNTTKHISTYLVLIITGLFIFTSCDDPTSTESDNIIPSESAEIDSDTGGEVASGDYSIVISDSSLSGDATVEISEGGDIPDIAEEQGLTEETTPLTITIDGAHIIDTVTVILQGSNNNPNNSLVIAERNGQLKPLRITEFDSDRIEVKLPPGEQEEDSEEINIYGLSVPDIPTSITPEGQNRSIVKNQDEPICLLVHGVLSDSDSWGESLRTTLSNYFGAGNLWLADYNWREHFDEVAQELLPILEETFGSTPIYIIAHSKGGLLSRRIIQLESDLQIQKLITLGTPHNGVPVGVWDDLSANLLDLGYAFLPDWFQIFINPLWDGLSECVTGSNELNSLNQNVTIDPIPTYFSIIGDIGEGLPTTPGNDDGVVSISSANMLNISPHETIYHWDSATFNKSHSQMNDDINWCWNDVEEFLDDDSSDDPVEPVEMVSISGGTFTMGDIWGDGYSNEQPTHQVTLSSFEISATEITNQKYADYLTEALSEGTISATSSSVTGTWEGNSYEFLDVNDSDCHISYSGGVFAVDSGKENYPVIEVSWYGATGFAEYYGCRLPTEAEWEYAARGIASGEDHKWSGTSTESELTDYAWYYENWDGNYHGREVATKLPNGNGLYDMSGNVWEWVSDWYGSYESGSQTNPEGPNSGSNRVVRGGSYGYDSYFLRCSNRYYYNPSNTYSFIGFRVCSVLVK